MTGTGGKGVIAGQEGVSGCGSVTPGAGKQSEGI